MRAFAVLIAAALVAVAAAGAATADRPRVRLVERPSGLAAGDAWLAQFELRRGGRPLGGARSSFWIASGSTARTFRASHAGRGRYRARVVFPAAGSWRYGVAVGGLRIALGSATVVAPPPEVVEPFAVAVAPDGRVAVADRRGGRVVLVGGDGLSVAASGLTPISVGFDRQGALHAGDDFSIHRVESGALTRVAGNGTRGFSGDGGPAAQAALGGPTGFGWDSAGRMFVSEYDGHIRVVGADGRIETIAGNGTEGFSGDDGPARAAVLAAPHDLDVLSDGTVIVADSHNGRIRRIDTAGVITTLASGFQAPVSVAVAPDGSIVVADAGTNRVYRLSGSGSSRTVVAGTGSPTSSGDGGPATRAALHAPNGVAVAPSGEIYVTEFEGRRVRRIDPRTGLISTIAR